ncbi:MAG: type II toxin-antitoxin system HicA family toxin [Thermoanaerobaculia bacterium]
MPRVSGSQCIAALSRAGFRIRRQQSSHVILRRDHPFAQLVVPDHKELDRERSGPSCARPESRSNSS